MTTKHVTGWPGTDGSEDRDRVLVDEGWFVAEDGEVVGRVDAPESFGIDSRDAAQWLVRCKSDIARDRSGLAAQEAAVLAQFARRRAQLEAREAYLDWRYGAQLEDWARRELAGCKSRSLLLDYGTVQIRKTRGTHRIADMAAATAWMESVAPGRVKVEKSVTVGDVLDVIGDESPEVLPWLESSGPGESVKVVTGIDVKRATKGDVRS